MTPAAGPFTIAALLLVVGGTAKARRPGDAASALRAVGLPVPGVAVRAGAVAEVMVGVFAVVDGGRLPAVLVGVSYLVFTGFVVAALARGTPLATCGCFGRLDTPPSPLHVAVDLGAVGAAAVVVADPGVGIADVMGAQPLAGVPYLLLVAVGTAAAMVALTSLPQVTRRSAPHGGLQHDDPEPGGRLRRHGRARARARARRHDGGPAQRRVVAPGTSLGGNPDPRTGLA